MRLFPWFVWALLVFGDFTFVATYGNNLPFQDEWTIVPVITGNQDVTWSWIWAQHNEHRLPLAKVAQVAIHHWSGMNFRAGMYVNVILLALAAAALMMASRQARSGGSGTDAIWFASPMRVSRPVPPEFVARCAPADWSDHIAAPGNDTGVCTP